MNVFLCENRKNSLAVPSASGDWGFHPQTPACAPLFAKSWVRHCVKVTLHTGR